MRPTWRRRRAAIVCTAILWCCAAGPAPSHADASPPADLDAYVARAMTTFDVPGLAVVIVVVAKGYGVRRLGDPSPVDAHTVFGIGSNTKAFTTAALATLVDAGKISWDDRVFQRLPGFMMHDAYVSQEMTIRDMLSHRSGMGSARVICSSGRTPITPAPRSSPGCVS